MADTKISDVINPAIFIPYQQERIPYKLALLQESGALIMPQDSILTQLAGGGRTIDAPFWNDLTRGEPGIPDDTDDVLVADKVSAAREKMTQHTLVKSWSTSDVAGWIATGDPNDPMRSIADGMDDWWYFATEFRIAKTLTGVLADNVANDGSDMLASVYSDVVSPTAANKISIQAVNEARGTAGSQLNGFRVILMHTHVYMTLLNDEKISFRSPSETTAGVPMYLNMMVIFSDEMPVTAGTNSPKYTCFLLGQGAISHRTEIPSNPTDKGTQGLEIHREPLVGNGGGRDTVITRRNQFLHPAGVGWLDASRAKEMAATAAELGDAVNWDRKYDRKNIKIAFLEVNV